MRALGVDSTQYELVTHGSGAGMLQPDALAEGVEAYFPLSHDVSELLYAHLVRGILAPGLPGHGRT
ncbi:MAG TPA: hypothetical protein VIE88_16480 [Vicinamibacteria bacterium]